MYDGVPPRPIVTKLERIQVTIPADGSNVLFSHVVEGLEFPMPKPAELDQYVVYIGFDPVGGPAEASASTPRRVRPSRRRPPQG